MTVKENNLRCYILHSPEIKWQFVYVAKFDLRKNICKRKLLFKVSVSFDFFIVHLICNCCVHSWECQILGSLWEAFKKPFKSGSMNILKPMNSVELIWKSHNTWEEDIHSLCTNISSKDWLRDNFILAAAVVQRAEISIEIIINPETSAWNSQLEPET